MLLTQFVSPNVDYSDVLVDNDPQREGGETSIHAANSFLNLFINHKDVIFGQSDCLQVALRTAQDKTYVSCYPYIANMRLYLGMMEVDNKASFVLLLFKRNVVFLKPGENIGPIYHRSKSKCSALAITSSPKKTLTKNIGGELFKQCDALCKQAQKQNGETRFTCILRLQPDRLRTEEDKHKISIWYT